MKTPTFRSLVAGGVLALTAAATLTTVTATAAQAVPGPACTAERAAVTAAAADLATKRDTYDESRATLATAQSTYADAVTGRQTARSELQTAQADVADRNSQYQDAKDAFVTARTAYLADRNPETLEAYNTASEDRTNARSALVTAQETRADKKTARTEAKTALTDARAARATATTANTTARDAVRAAQTAFTDAVAARTACLNPPPPATATVTNLYVALNTVFGDVTITGLTPGVEYRVFPVNLCASFGVPDDPQGCYYPVERADSDGTGRWLDYGVANGCHMTSSETFRVYRESDLVQVAEAVGTWTPPC